MSEPITPKVKEDCSCLEGNFYYLNVETTPLGGNSLSGEVDLLACKVCGRLWLSIFYEPKVYDDAGVWYNGLIQPETVPAIREGNVLQNALAYLASLEWYYTSGTYWTDIGLKVPFKTRGEIRLWS